MTAPTYPVCRDCGIRISTGDAMRTPRLCPDCRVRSSTPEAKAAAALESTIANSYQLEGAPWWESKRTQVVVSYEDVEGVNSEVPIATPLGWRIATIAAVGSHLNAGRMAAGAVVGGVVGAALTASRSGGAVMVVWDRIATA